MHLVLHVGTEKTGTTAAQSFFARNRAELLKHGILYPLVFGTANHTALSVIFRPFEYADELFAQSGVGSHSDHAKLKDRLIREFADEIRFAEAQGAHTCLLSNEHLHSRLNRLEHVAILKDFLTSMFQTVTVVASLRPQIELALSLASTAARVGLRVDSDFFDRTVVSSSLFYNYSAAISLWEAAFSPENIRILAYKNEPSFAKYFLAANNIVPSGFRPEHRENVSLSVNIMALTNALGPEVAKIQGQLDRLPKGDKLAIGRAFSQHLQSRFEPSNRKLVDRRSDIRLADITPDWSRFDAESNVHLLDRGVPFERELRQLLFVVQNVK